MKTKKKQPRLPKGWTLEKVEAVRKHYESQTDEDAAKEDDAAYKRSDICMVAVPIKLLPKVRRLIATYS